MKVGKDLHGGRRETAPYKRVRVIEFAGLPKTISGKIRRVELREHAASGPGDEYREAPQISDDTG